MTSAAAVRARALGGLYASGRRVARNMSIVALFILFAAVSMLVAAFVMVGVVGEEARLVAMPLAIVALAVGACAYFLRKAAQSYRRAELHGDITALADGIAFETAYWRATGITTLALIAAMILPVVVMRAAQKFVPDPAVGTVKQMQIAGDALEKYAAEHHRYPNAKNLDVLASVLAPYLKEELPRIDGWRRPFVYQAVCDQQQTCYDYRFVSLGANGELDVKLEQLNSDRRYSCDACPVPLQDLEIVHSGGRFLLSPPGVQPQ